jgi:hypothetical protein
MSETIGMKALLLTPDTVLLVLNVLGMHVLLDAEGDEVGDVFVFLIHSIRFMAKVMILY